MKIWGVTEQEIRDAVAEVGLAVFGGWSRSGIEKDGRALRLRLSVNQLSPRNSNGFLPYQRKSMSTMNSRRIAAVCWHGHREFMRAIFKRNLEARIKTALADYRGAEDFEQKFEATFGQGNEYHLSYGQSCDCPEVATTGTMRHSDVLACPHVILDLKHYRPDGSCRCDDPSEQRRMMAEWGYSPADFATVGIPEFGDSE